MDALDREAKRRGHRVGQRGALRTEERDHLGGVRTIDRHATGRGLEAAVTYRAFQAVHGADELGDEAGARMKVDVLRAADLGDAALLHHDDAVAEHHGLGLVVGDVDGGDPETAQQRVDLGAQALAQCRVERGQRLIEQEQPRPNGERPRQCNALTLAARKLIDAARGELARCASCRGFRAPARRARQARFCGP